MAIRYGKELEELFYEKLSNEIGKFHYDNLKSEDGKDILGFFKKVIIQLDFILMGDLILMI